MFKGLGYALRGFKIMFSPGIKRFVVIPLLVNTLLFGGLIWFAWEQLQTLMHWVVAQLPAWLDWLSWLLVPLFVIATLLVVVYGFSIVANLIAAPFNSLLAERVERQLSGAVMDNSSSTLDVIKAIVPTLVSELRKLLYFALRAVPLLILFVIPGVNVVAPLLWFLFTAWMLSIEYTDYPMGNHELLFGTQRKLLGRRRLQSLGFGATMNFLNLIPVVNFFVMPAAVCGATAFWVNSLQAVHSEN